MTRQIYGEEVVCPNCGGFLSTDINVGDGYTYDICSGCGHKRKKNLDGQLVNELGEVVRKDVKV